MATNYYDEAQVLFVGGLDRAANYTGFTWAANDLISNANNPAFFDSFVTYNGSPITSSNFSANATGITNQIFNDLMGRNAQPAGVTWVSNLMASTGSISQVILDVYNTVLGEGSSSTDYNVMEDKLTAANNFSNYYSPSGTGYTTANATGYINQVTSAWVSLGNTVSNLPTVANYVSGNTGQTYNLIAGIDNITGASSGNNVFYGLVSSTASTSTLSAIDTINGGTGSNNTLHITVAGSFSTDVLNSANVSNMQTVDIHDVSSASGTFNASQITGLTAVNSDLSTAALTVTKLASGATAGIIGNGTLANGNVSFDWVSAATSATLDVTGGVTAGAVTFANSGSTLTSVTIDSAGAANVLAGITDTNHTIATVTIDAATSLTTGGFTDSALTTIDVNGAASSVGLGTLPSAVTTVDASGMTAGGVTATLDAAITSFKGGAGNDTVTVSSAITATTAGEISGGGGTGNKLIVGAAAAVSSSSKGAEFTNFQILQNNAAATLNVSYISGITAINLNASGAGASSLSTAQAADITNMTDNASATIATTNTNSTVDVTLSNSTSAANMTGLTLTNVENLNVTNNAGASSTVSFTSASVLADINVSGSQTTTLDISGAATTLTTINASGLTAQPTGTNTFTLEDTGGSHALTAGLTITGSAGDDSISLNTDTIASGVVTINAGAGNDSITATLGQLYTAGSGYLVVNGGSGTNTLTISDTTANTINDNTFAHVSNIQTLDFSDTGAITLITGGFFDSAFSSGGVTLNALHIGAAVSDIELTSDTGAATINVTTGATTENTTVIASVGADTINVIANSDTTGVVSVTGNTGAATITVDATAATAAGAVVIHTGTGIDAITLDVALAAAAATENVNIGTNSSITGSSYDTVTGFNAGTASDYSGLITFGSAAVQGTIATTTVSGYTASQLTFAVNGSGMLTFTGTATSGLTAAQLDALAIASVKSTIAADMSVHNTIAYYDGANTFLFNENASGTSVVELVGVQTTAISTTNATTAHLVTIA